MEAAPIVALPSIADANDAATESQTTNVKTKKAASGRSRRKPAPKTTQTGAEPKAQAERVAKEPGDAKVKPASASTQAPAEPEQPQADQPKPRNRRRGTRRKASSAQSSREAIIAAAEEAANGGTEA